MAKKSGAGILFICSDDNSVLLVQRSQMVSEPGTWGLPGGGSEGNETPVETSIREVREELGSMPHRFNVVNKMIKNDDVGIYYIFILNISLKEKEIWNIKLNFESDRYHWFKTGHLPSNLHSAIDIIAT